MKAPLGLLLASLLILSGCSDEPAPADVADAFWQAVIKNDPQQIQTLSAKGTLENPKSLDNSGNSVKGVEFGDTVEEGEKARVITTLIGETDAKGEATRLEIDTVLVQEGQQWKVDANATTNNLMAKSVNAMMLDMSKSFEQLGKQVSESLSSGIQAFMQEMNKSLPEVKQGLEKLQDPEAAQDIGENLGKVFASGLQQIMGELNESMEALSKELEAEAQKQPAGAQPADKI